MATAILGGVRSLTGPSTLRHPVKLLYGAFEQDEPAARSRSFAARASDCGFVSRDEAADLLEELPINVLGWAKCTKEKDADHLFVTKTAFTDGAELEEYSSALAMMLDAGSHSAKKTWQSKSALDRREITIVTDRGPGKEKTMHYIFLARDKAGDQYLFIHTASERETLKLRPTLDRIHDYLVRDDFLKSIEAGAEMKVAMKK